MTLLLRLAMAPSTMALGEPLGTAQCQLFIPVQGWEIFELSSDKVSESQNLS